MNRLKNRVVVVTGTSRGLGKAIAYMQNHWKKLTLNPGARTGIVPGRDTILSMGAFPTLQPEQFRRYTLLHR